VWLKKNKTSFEYAVKYLVQLRQFMEIFLFGYDFRNFYLEDNFWDDRG